MGLDKNKRPLFANDYANIRVTVSSSASTALAPRGVISMATTSTGAPVVWTLASAPKKGRRFSVHATSIATSSAGLGIHINAASGSFLGSSSQEMLELNFSGQGASFVGLSTTRWACVGNNGGVFSSST